jgi:all-trans-retinol 13,14-reductase
MKTERTKYNVIVIGSGIAGLSAATLLAQNGLSVAVVEKSHSVAPYLSRFKRAGVWCDPSFHYIGGLSETSSFTTLLKYLQVYQDFELLPMDEHAFDIINVKGKEYRIPYGYNNISAYLCSQFPASAEAVKIFIDKVRSIYQETALLNYDRDFRENSLFQNEDISLHDYLLRLKAEEALIDLLEAHGVILAGSYAAEIPLVFYAYIVGSYYIQANTLKRGGDTVVTAFKSRLERLSVPVYTKSEVKAILADENKRVTGVRLGDEHTVDCNHIVSTIHPQLLLSLLPVEKLKPIYLNRLKNLENTPSPFAVFYELDQVPEKLKRSNYYKVAHRTGKQPDTGSIGLMNLNQDTDAANKKSFTVFAYCSSELTNQFFDLINDHESGNGRQDKTAYEQLKTKITAQIEKRVIEQFPELRNSMKYLASATPVTYERYSGTIKGATYGAKQTIQQHTIGTKSRLHGLYLAGQSVMPGVMGGVISSLLATIFIVGPDKIWKGIKACR